jgi:hypothetical protein
MGAMAFASLAALILVSCIAPSPTPQGTATACHPTPVLEPIGRLAGNLAARTGDRLIAGGQAKVLWLVRVPHADLQLRLKVERLDGPGSGQVIGITRAGPLSGLPAGWERAVAYPSNVTFDSAGCWRVRDLDGSEPDAVVFEIAAPDRPSASISPGARGPAREPKDLPELADEARVIAALASVGLRPENIAASKFQDLFGERRPARVFYAGNTVPGAWRVDIVFLDEAAGVRVCSTDGRHEYTIRYKERPYAMSSTQEVFFATSDRMLVMASERTARDALLTALDLSVPTC